MYNSPVIVAADRTKKTQLTKRNSPLWNSKRQVIFFKFDKRNVFLLFAWIAFAFVGHKVLTTEITEQRWDPYEILGVSVDSSIKEVKKAFRKLSLQFHPDKVEEKDKLEAESRYFNTINSFILQIRRRQQGTQGPHKRRSKSNIRRIRPSGWKAKYLNIKS